MLEPDVVITDYLLALECGLFAWILGRYPASSLRNRLVLFFISTAIAGTLGGTVHGFFPVEGSAAGHALWRLTLVAIGFTAFSLWSIWAILFLPQRISQVVQAFAAIELLAYAIYELSANRSFLTAIADYLPAVLILLISVLIAYGKKHDANALEAALGFTLALVASYLQQRGVGIHPVYFNHNALYHVLQGVALFLLFHAARRFLIRRTNPQ